MMRFLRWIFLASALVAVPACASDRQSLTVFAAASLRGALEDIAAAYGGKLVLSYGGSGQIARQVAQGAPADVVILANVIWMDWLEAQGSIGAGNRLDLLGNSLVLVGPQGAEPLTEITADSLLQRLTDRRLAMGQTQGVPAGIYGRQWLENTGFWPQLAPRLAETENVRAALTLVARGEAPLGLVYGTDAEAEDGVVILYRIPDDMHDPIIYPAAMIDNENAAESVDFMEFITSPGATDIFRRHGFVPLAGSP